MTTPLRAISLWQPYAHAMAVGCKRIETRHWRTKHRGDLAIHAAKRWTVEERNHWAAMHRVRPELWPEQPDLGAIVAVVELIDVYETERIRGLACFHQAEAGWGNYGDNRYGWMTGRLRRLAQPVPTRGMQSLWTLPDDIAAQVWVQLP